MKTDTIVHGETYDISIQIQDENGDPVVIDNTWSVACRVTSLSMCGSTVAEPTMTIANGGASCSIDTGESNWYPGTFYYDIRLTDPDGNDYWTEPVQLTLLKRNTPSS